MHDCQKFREDWIAGSAEEAAEGADQEVMDCLECRNFCEEAAVILQATEAQPVPEFAEAYWERYDDRLRVQLFLENASRRRQFYWKWSTIVAAAAAIVLVIAWGAGMRVATPPVETVTAAPEIQFVDDHIRGLNPAVVSFLGQSELFLRNFTKIDPSYSYKEDLHEAQARAKQGLAEIEKQKVRAADFAPVRIALDEYESVLRDIKNLDSDSADDVADIQSLIRSSGLIASMKAYQPQVMLVTHR